MEGISSMFTLMVVAGGTFAVMQMVQYLILSYRPVRRVAAPPVVERVDLIAWRKNVNTDWRD